MGIIAKLFGKKKFRFRSAITGKWVSAAFAKANPRETVRELIKE